MQINIGGESISSMRASSLKQEADIQDILDTSLPTYNAIIGTSFKITTPPDTLIMHLGDFESLERRMGSTY